MKKTGSKIWLLSMVMLIVIASCTAQPPVQVTMDAAATNTVGNTQVPETAAATSTASEPTPTASPEPTETIAPTATLEPTAALEPTATTETVVVEATSAPVNSGSPVYLTLAANTICRTGPATVYQSVTSIPAGKKISVAGRLAKDSPYYYVENPDEQGSQCWVYGQGATLEGDQSGLLLIEPLPSPTPNTHMNFSITYSTIKKCGDDYSFSFIVKNTDKVVWRSIKVRIVDVKTMNAAQYQSDGFVEWVNCHRDNLQMDLAEGEHAYMTPYNPGHFDYRPWGKTFLLKVTLCTEAGMKGDCLSKEIKVKP